VTIPHTEVHAMRAVAADADFELWIAPPVAGWRGLPEGPLGVLYVLDANLFFGTAVETTRLMHQLYGELPPLLVVGIAHPTDDPMLQAELRARDFTPTADAGFAQMAGSLPGGRAPALPEDRRLGRAAEFLAFLRDQVRPHVEERFDVAAGRSALWGSSLGGLFSLYAALTAPTSFDAFVAVSPALWWDDTWLLRRERELATSAAPRPEQVVLAVGAQEERADVPMLARFGMVTHLRTLADRLSSGAYPELRLSTHVLDGESHTSVVAPALSRGLRDVFAG
jgi:predicted alpha/beta superfamily hydrolase